RGLVFLRRLLRARMLAAVLECVRRPCGRFEQRGPELMGSAEIGGGSSSVTEAAAFCRGGARGRRKRGTAGGRSALWATTVTAAPSGGWLSRAGRPQSTVPA